MPLVFLLDVLPYNQKEHAYGTGTSERWPLV